MPDPTFNLSATPADAQPRLFVEPAPAPGTEAATNGKPGRKAKATVVGFEPPNLGKVIRLPVPDFDDPERKPTCLEIDFPIAEINALSKVEVSSGPARKRVYCMSKWWARRASSVFRSMLIAAAAEAPDDRTKAAALVWDHYYANHGKAGSFKGLRVFEPFMGGGTTVVEGSRLGFTVTGIDLNPVAWFVTKNEVACSDPVQVKALFDHIEEEVKPQIQPYYTTTCPRGHKGRWIDSRKVRRNGDGSESIPSEAIMPHGFDTISLRPEERKPYRWEGPEIVYTFWAKHGPCKGSQGKPCGHRTPIFRSPIIAEKKLSGDYLPIDCPHCGCAFHAELGATRLAPGSERVVAENESPFTETTQPFAYLFAAWSQLSAPEKRSRVAALLARVEDEPGLHCPSCSRWAGQTVKRTLEKHGRANRAGDIKRTDYGIESKPIYMYLLVHPKWLEGSAGILNGVELGGWVGADPDASAAWYRARLQGLALIEVRGRVKLAEDEGIDTAAEASDEEETKAGAENERDDLDRKLFGPPRTLTLADGTRVDTRRGSAGAQKSSFRCAVDDLSQDILESVSATNRTPPAAPYALQCLCPQCKSEGVNYGGRFFKVVDSDDMSRLIAVEKEWSERSTQDLSDWWPRSECWDSYMMRANGGVNTRWGYSHWWKMFNARELLCHSLLLREIADGQSGRWPTDVREQALGAWQEFSRHHSMFCFWDIQQDCLAPMLANANYHPKILVVENNLWLPVGRSNWASCLDGVLTGLRWCGDVSELVINPESGGSKTLKVSTQDSVRSEAVELFSGSASDLPQIPDCSIDLAITDPDLTQIPLTGFQPT